MDASLVGWVLFLATHQLWPMICPLAGAAYQCSGTQSSYVDSEILSLDNPNCHVLLCADFTVVVFLKKEGGASYEPCLSWLPFW